MGDVPPPSGAAPARRPEARGSRGRGLTLRWILLLGWVAVVWNLGGADFSHAETSRFLGPLIRRLWPSIDSGTLESVHFLVRKSAHVVEYGLTCVLALAAFAPLLWPSRRALLAAALGLCALLATADELRQLGTAGRSGALGDVALDLGGAVAAAGALWLLPGAWRARWLAPSEPSA